MVISYNIWPLLEVMLTVFWQLIFILLFPNLGPKWITTPSKHLLHVNYHFLKELWVPLCFDLDKNQATVNVCCVCVCVCVHAHAHVCSVVSNSLCPLDCSPPGSSIHGIFQARILEQVAISYSRGSSWPRGWTHVSWVSCLGQWILYHCATWETTVNIVLN